MKTKCPTRTELISQYKKVKSKSNKLWDKYNGKTPLSNPSKNKRTHTPEVKKQLLSTFKEKEALERTWKKCGYSKR